MTQLSVVVPVFNVASTLRAALDALCAQTWDGDWEIVVVDNGSTDETPSILAEYQALHPRLRVVREIDGQGVNFARNRGFLEARGAWVALCDGDDVVGPHWVEAMATALQSHRLVTGPIDVQSLNPAWLVRTRGEFPTDGPRTYYGIFPVAAGGNLAIHREVWESIGRFRTDIVGAVDDIEFCLRAWQAGVTVGFAPDAVIAYRYRAEPKSLWRHGRFYGKGKPLIAKTLHDRGLPTPPRLAGWKSWVTLVRWLPRLRTLEGRAAWLWVAGNRVGQLEGCWHYRTFWL